MLIGKVFFCLRLFSYPGTNTFCVHLCFTTYYVCVCEICMHEDTIVVDPGNECHSQLQFTIDVLLSVLIQTAIMSLIINFRSKNTMSSIF